MSLKELGDVSYFRLNNEINRPVNGQIPLHKDQEAVKAFFKENVLPNTKQFMVQNLEFNWVIKLLTKMKFLYFWKNTNLVFLKVNKLVLPHHWK